MRRKERERIVLAFIQRFFPRHDPVLEEDKDENYSSFARTPPIPLTTLWFSTPRKGDLMVPLTYNIARFSRDFSLELQSLTKVCFCLFT